MASYKYCSNKCQLEYQYLVFIDNWQKGLEKGLSCLGLVTPQIKRFLRKKYGNKCSLCGWSQINLKSGKVPLVADHIDGNWRNNIENNLRLICPNCDSISPTYAALNKGNGRKGRTVSKRARDAKMMIRKMPK